MQIKGSKGFTLLEVMIALVVAAVLVVGVAPNLSNFINRNRAAATTNDFMAALQYARSEALNRGLSTILCRSPQVFDSDSACTNANLASDTHCSCATTTSSSNADGWEDGWLIVADADRNNTVSVGDDLLRLQGPIGGGYTIRGNTNVGDNIRYAQNASALTAGSVFICGPGSDTEAGSQRILMARKISINFPGHATASAFSGTNSCFP